MAHVLDLPGCCVRATSRDEAIRRLPEAIREYHAWLENHGAGGDLPEAEIEIVVAEEIHGTGPFDPGDAAGFFTPDRMLVTTAEMEDYFSLMTYSRSDLLSVINDLPASALDWQPEAKSFSIRRTLRHIGNAEEWYVSRLLPPEKLPHEWNDDDQLPILDFLDMERRTALDCLRQLTEIERSQVFYPTCWTEHPEEPWSLRKVLRRFLEHECEHTNQICSLLAGWQIQER